MSRIIFASLLLTTMASAADWTNSFDVDKSNLASVGRNDFFVLEPGHALHYESEEETLKITVLPETKIVDGVETRVVEEREKKNGKLVEISRNYFAIDKTTNDVYYFGEDVDIYKNGKVIANEGAWLSGLDGAKFGMMMPGKPIIGDKFYQEHAPGKAMDRCEIVALDGELETPAGTFTNCLRAKETSALERGSSYKIYAPGVGLIKDGDCLLVKVASDQEAANELAKVQGTWVRTMRTNSETFKVIKEHKGHETTVTWLDLDGNVVAAKKSEFRLEQTGKVRIFTFFNNVITAGPQKGQTDKAPTSYIYRVTGDTFVEVNGLLIDDEAEPVAFTWKRVNE